MAAHADAAAVEAAAAQPPCHGDEAANAADEAGHADSGSCCQPGHCLCACVFSVSLPFAPGAGASPVRGRLAAPARDVRLPPARHAVPLRPPIA